MFSFFKKQTRSQDLDLSVLHTDMHAHFIPGIDDGAKTAEDSLALVKGLIELGYNKLVATPHIMSEIYPNTPEIINASLDGLKEALYIAGLETGLSAAAEYFMDEYFDAKLRKDEPLLTISGNLVLVEFSFVTTPMNANETFFEMQVKGYRPVLAHPERYLYFSQHRSQYEELKKSGCLFQVNLLSLTGYYGKLAMELAQYLVHKGFVDLLGTDMHHARHLDTLRSSGFIMDTIDKLMDSGNILNPRL